MKRALPILLDTLYALALALWFGLAAGFLVVAQSGIPAATLSLFAQRAGGLIEAAGMTMVGVQFLLRRRYGRIRQLAVVDGGRQLLTFGALLPAEFGHYSLLKPDHTLGSHDVTVLCQLAGAQMLILAIVTVITSWLLVPRTMAGSSSTPPESTSAGPIAPSATQVPAKPMKPKVQAKRR